MELESVRNNAESAIFFIHLRLLIPRSRCRGTGRRSTWLRRRDVWRIDRMFIPRRCQLLRGLWCCWYLVIWMISCNGVRLDGAVLPHRRSPSFFVLIILQGGGGWALVDRVGRTNACAVAIVLRRGTWRASINHLGSIVRHTLVAGFIDNCGAFSLPGACTRINKLRMMWVLDAENSK